MTINITLSEQDISQASKALTELIQTCAEVAQTDAPRNNNSNNNNSAAPKAKAKPKAETAPAPKAEPAETTPEVAEPDETAVDYAALRETLKAECAAIARSGKSAGLKQLLADYGTEKLSGLPDDKLEEFRTGAKAL